MCEQKKIAYFLRVWHFTNFDKKVDNSRRNYSSSISTIHSLLFFLFGTILLFTYFNLFNLIYFTQFVNY